MPTSPGCSDPRISKRCLRATTTTETITINRNKMEQINSPIRERQSVSNLPVESPQLSPDVLRKTQLVRQKYGSLSDFMRVMTPDQQMFAAKNPERAFFGEAPTLAIMRKTYGDNFPASWLLPQIYDLVVYCNSKGTLNEQQMEFLAEAIVNEYFYLKASELLLFFYRFKTGAYGHFYGVVDPMKIIMALDEFRKERDMAIRKHEHEVRDKAVEDHAKTAITAQEYCRRKGIPEMTTEQLIASAIVKPPTDCAPTR